MKKLCMNCKKEFTPARNRKESKFCSILCYQKIRTKPNKFDWGQFVWDGACIMAPILILAFAVYCITPKDDLVSVKENMQKDIEHSCCWDDEDEKYLAAILKRK